MSTSSIRDPLDRLVTRREAHAIAVHVVNAMLEAMQQAEQRRQNEQALTDEAQRLVLYGQQPDADMGERVRAGG